MLIDALLDLIRRVPTTYMRNAVLIPIPGSKRAIRKRGRDFIFSITKEVSLRTGIPMMTGLHINRRLIDQSRLSAQDRSRNISGAFEFSGPVNDFKDSKNLRKEAEIFLVDDLVTTGATLLEAKRALNSAGFQVNRAITACVAQTLNIGG